MPHESTVRVCPQTGRIIDVKSAPPASAPASSRHAPPTDSGRGAGAQSQGSMDVPRDMLGRTLGGRYVLRDVLGAGGMGTVFDAEHLGLKRAVAIKVLNPSQARKKTAVKRFQQEARAAGSIGHPNICEVYDLGALEDGSPYLVMEKLTGKTLAQRLTKEQRLPWEEIVEIVLQTLSGLAAAHDKGIVHRDIKPDNIFIAKRVGASDIIKVVDFGVSKMIVRMQDEPNEDLDLTRTGMVMGTPYYMSPEQASGERKLDARVDLYACGVVMYEAVTGRRPFLAPNYNALLLKIISGTHRRASELLPSVPRGFEGVIERAIAVNREDRYGSAAEMQRDLLGLRASAISVPKPPQKSREMVQDLDLVTDLDATMLAKPNKPVQKAPPPQRAREPSMDSIEIDVTFSESATGPRAAEPEPEHEHEHEEEAPASHGHDPSPSDWDEMPTEVFKPHHVPKQIGFRRMPVPFPIPKPDESLTSVHRPGIFDDDDDDDDDNVPTHLTKRKVAEEMATLQDPNRRPRRK
jgi:serine/threonine-protein kinase